MGYSWTIGPSSLARNAYCAFDGSLVDDMGEKAALEVLAFDGKAHRRVCPACRQKHALRLVMLANYANGRSPIPARLENCLSGVRTETVGFDVLVVEHVEVEDSPYEIEDVTATDCTVERTNDPPHGDDWRLGELGGDDDEDDDDE